MPAMSDATNRPVHLSPHSAKAVRAAPEPQPSTVGGTPGEQLQPSTSTPGQPQPSAGTVEGTPEPQPAEDTSLQDSFAAFRAKRAAALKKKKARGLKARAATEARRRDDPQFKVELRRKFVQRVRHYLGVPYSLRAVKQLCEVGAPEFESEHFLDCCGLVRQVLRDLADEFGFVVGPWNQAYLFETDIHSGDVLLREAQAAAAQHDARRGFRRR
jgi:hypothetical protein